MTDYTKINSTYALINQIMNELVKGCDEGDRHVPGQTVFCSEADFKTFFVKVADKILKGCKEVETFRIYIEDDIYSMIYPYGDVCGFMFEQNPWTGKVGLNIDRTHIDVAIHLKYKNGRGFDGLNTSEQVILIEFKYKLKARINEQSNRFYHLYEDGYKNFEIETPDAYPKNKYGFVKDIYKIENVLKYTSERENIGYAIFLTNDKEYWTYNKGTRSKAARDYQFSEFDEKGDKMKLEARMHLWDGEREEDRASGDHPGLRLLCDYDISWSEKLSAYDDRIDDFRYLMVEVKRQDVIKRWGKFKAEKKALENKTENK